MFRYLSNSVFTYLDPLFLVNSHFPIYNSDKQISIHRPLLKDWSEKSMRLRAELLMPYQGLFHKYSEKG